MGNPALIVTDIQNDFCPEGALGINGGDKVIKPLNRLINLFEKRQFPIILTRDWHPKNHCSFKKYGGIWPPHCIKNTKGAEFHKELVVPENALIVSKATNPKIEAYSSFKGTNLTRILRKNHVTDFFIGGLATEYCVKNSVHDALEQGFTVYVLEDCIKGVNLKRSDSANAIREMERAGAKKISSAKMNKILEKWSSSKATELAV